MTYSKTNRNSRLSSKKIRKSRNRSRLNKKKNNSRIRRTRPATRNKLNNINNQESLLDEKSKYTRKLRRQLGKPDPIDTVSLLF